jgi:5'-deoxynucleotidase YfbR-like HD superfamily hydrolase
MTDIDPTRNERAQEAHDYLLKLGEISIQMAGVSRQVVYAEDRPENDAEHSYHLGLSAVEIAANYYPELDAGLIAQFSYVHDLAEVYAGDTPSHNLTKEERVAKETNEKNAVERLLTELPPHTAALLQRYEEQEEPEARFVRFVDKLLPSIIHSLVPEPNREVLARSYGYANADDLLVKRAERTAMLREMFPEFDFIHEIRDLTAATARKRIYSQEN